MGMNIGKNSQGLWCIENYNLISTNVNLLQIASEVKMVCELVDIACHHNILWNGMWAPPQAEGA